MMKSRNTGRKGVHHSLWIVVGTVIFFVIVVVGIIWFGSSSGDVRDISNVTQNRSLKFLECDILCSVCCHQNDELDCSATGNPDIDKGHCQDSKPTEFGC